MSILSLKVIAFALVALGLGLVVGVGVGGLAPFVRPSPTHSVETFIAPNNLNLHSQGNWVTAILKNMTALRSDLKASELTATASVFLKGSDVSLDALVRAYNGTFHIVIVKIDRQQLTKAVSDALATGASVPDPLTITVTVSGGGASVTRTGSLHWFSRP